MESYKFGRHDLMINDKVILKGWMVRVNLCLVNYSSGLSFKLLGGHVSEIRQ